MKQVVFLLILLFSIQDGKAQEYLIDAAHTSVEFEIAHFKINIVKGTFQDVSGSLSYSDQTEQLAVNVKVAASSINTHNDARDNHLKSADFFDVQKFPEILFKSKQVKKSKKQWVVIGDLTMHGVTREVRIPFSISKPFKDPLPRGVMRLVVHGTLDVDRRDYNLIWSRVMESGELFVGNEVHLEINSEFYIPKG